MSKGELLYYITFLILISSCKISKDTTILNICDIKEKRVLQNCANQNIAYRTLKIQKVQINYKDENISISLKGWMRLIHDSCILISLNPGLGIEMGRIYIFPDTMYYLNRINKEVSWISASEIKNRYFKGYSLYLLQDLILGNMVEYKMGDDLKKISKCDEGKNFLIHSWLKDSISIRNFINSDYKIARLELDDRLVDQYININYEYNTDEIIERIIIIASLKKKYYSIEIKFNKIVVNENLNVNFKIPDNYSIKMIE